MAAFAKDTSKAAEAVKALLDDPTPEAAEKLLADLPSLIPDDPALAAVIADAMAAEFSPEGRARTPAAPPQNTEAMNTGTSEGAKKGWETRRKNGWTPEQIAENKVKVATLAKKALTDRTSDDSVDMGTIEGAATEDIKKLTGVDVTGYSQEITTHDIRHEDKRHGPPRKIGKKNRTPVLHASRAGRHQTFPFTSDTWDSTSSCGHRESLWRRRCRRRDTASARRFSASGRTCLPSRPRCGSHAPSCRPT